MWLIIAAASAVCFGFRGILYHWTSQKPLDRNLLLFAVYLCGTVVAAVASLFTGQAWTYGDFMGISMGFFSFISNASMYKGFAVGKASLVAIFCGLPPVGVVAGAYLLWGETPGMGQLVAFVIILGGIVLIRYSNDLSFSNLQGVQWGLLAMFGFALTDLSSKQSILWEGQVFPTLTVMYTTGALLFLLSWRKQESSRKLREMAQESLADRSLAQKSLVEKGLLEKGLVEKNLVENALDQGKLAQNDQAQAKKQVVQWSHGRTLLWGFFVGLTNVSGMMLILPAFKLGVTGLVSAIIATNVLIILIYVRIFLKNRFTRSEVWGIALAISGIILLRLLGKS